MLRPDIDTSIPALMERYDPHVKGYLDGEAFAQLQNEICVERKDHWLDLSEKIERRFELLEYKLGLVLNDKDNVLKGAFDDRSSRESAREASVEGAFLQPRRREVSGDSPERSPMHSDNTKYTC